MSPYIEAALETAADIWDVCGGLVIFVASFALICGLIMLTVAYPWVTAMLAALFVASIIGALYWINLKDIKDRCLVERPPR